MGMIILREERKGRGSREGMGGREVKKRRGGEKKKGGGNKEKKEGDFPGGTVVKNPPANAADTGSSPGPGRSHMQWSS